MGAGCAIRVTADFIRRGGIVVALVVIAIRTLMLMLMMAEVLARLARLMSAIGIGDTPGKLEHQCDDEQLEEALDHKIDYNKISKRTGVLSKRFVITTNAAGARDPRIEESSPNPGQRRHALGRIGPG